MSILLASGPVAPSIFNLNKEAAPPEKLTFESRIFCELLLNILKDLVTDPTEVKTVSKNKVSEDVDKDASLLVIYRSFLHEINTTPAIINTTKARNKTITKNKGI